jgi:hypothetical protein
LTKLEKEMDVSGVYLVMIPYRESFLALWGAHELNLKLLRNKQALVFSNKPGKGEDGAAPDIASDFPAQWLPPVLEIPKKGLIGQIPIRP